MRITQPTRHHGIVFGGLVALCMATVACSGQKQAASPDDQAAQAPTLTDNDEDSIDEEDETLQFDEEAAKVVLERSRRKAVNCASVAPDTPQTEGDVYVQFDGPKGRSVSVKLSVDFQVGSEQGQQCIKNAFLGEIIPPFEGTKTVTYRLDLTSKKK